MSWISYLVVESLWSQNLWIVLIVVVAYDLTRHSLHWLKLNRSLPPGPYGLPLVGYLPFLKRPDDIRSEMTDLSLKYGPCFSLRLGSELMVILSDHRLIREAFRCPVFDARPRNEFFKLIKGYGIVNAEGMLWKEQRRFLRKHLRQFGADEKGSDLLESRIMVEIREMLGNLSEKKSEPIFFDTYLIPAVSNVICSLLMSIRFRPDEPRFLRFTALIEEGFRLFTVVGAAAFMPILRLLPHFSRGFRSLNQNCCEILNFSQQVVEEHKLNLDYQSPAKDLVDAYIRESLIAEDGNGGRLFAGMDPNRQIQQMIADLFSAGTETIQTTLRWAAIFALREPELQYRVQKEIDTVVGRKRMPSLKDLKNLPFTEAFLLEVMRRTTTVPLGTPHVASETTTLRGMTIPKGAQVIPLLHAVHMNPDLWEEPERFHPERFLSEDGMTVNKPDYFIPFGIGRRSCPGDTLAISQLFLFFSSLLHSFDIRLPDGVTNPPDLDGMCGATFSPKPFRVCMIPRNHSLSEDSEVKNK